MQRTIITFLLSVVLTKSHPLLSYTVINLSFRYAIFCIHVTEITFYLLCMELSIPSRITSHPTPHHTCTPPRTPPHPICIPLLMFVGCGSIVVRWLHPQPREPRFESSCCCFETLAILFIPHCHSSLSYINEYLAIDRDGYRNE